MCAFVTIDSQFWEADQAVCWSDLWRDLLPSPPLPSNYLQTGSDHSFFLSHEQIIRSAVSNTLPHSFCSLACSKNVLFSFLNAHTHAKVAYQHWHINICTNAGERLTLSHSRSHVCNTHTHIHTAEPPTDHIQSIFGVFLISGGCRMRSVNEDMKKVQRIMLNL